MSLVLGIREKPKDVLQWAGLSIQHVFAMFGSTILVPFLTNLDISVALFASGLGTLIYILCTKAKVPVYLGSSFAYIAAIGTATAEHESAFVGLVVVGIIYIIVATIIRFSGKAWIDFMLPAVVVGPMIIVIGLVLAPTAIDMTGLNPDPSNLKFHGITYDAWKAVLVAAVTFLTTVIVATKTKGFLKLIPFLIGILAGYTLALILGIVDFDPVTTAKIIEAPKFQFIGTYDLNLNAVLTFLPLAFVTIAEHIGDHKVLGEICEEDFLNEPGLENTLLGDGIATAVSGMLGGPANTTYGENTGVVAMTGVGSVWVIGTAAIIAIIMSLFGHVSGIIQTIPSPVMGGISMVLFGLIALNGFKVLKKANIDLEDTKNVIIIAAMVVVGLGGASIKINDAASLEKMALAAITGILLNLMFKVLNLILPE